MKQSPQAMTEDTVVQPSEWFAAASRAARPRSVCRCGLIHVAASVLAVCLAAGAVCGQVEGTYAEHIAAGMTLLRQGKWEEAVQRYDQALAAAANDAQRAQALLRKAEALQYLRRYEDAMAEFKRVTELAGAGDYHRLAAWRGIGRCAAAAGDMAAQLKAYEGIVQSPVASDSERAQALVRIGNVLLQMGEEDKAARIFAQVASTYPRQPATSVARYRLVQHYVARGDLDSVGRLLKQARSLNLTDVDSLYSAAAQELARRGRLKQALAIAEELLAFHPYSPVGWLVAWRVHQQIGDAQAFVEAGLEKAGEDRRIAEGLLAIAGELARRGRPDDLARAMELYEKLVDAVPASSPAVSTAAEAALKAGRLDLADRWSERAIGARGRAPAAQSVRIRVLAATGRAEQAFELAKSMARFRPADVRSARTLVGILNTTGLEDMLPRVVEQVRQASGEAVALAAELSGYYQRRGRWGEAVSELAAALRAGEVSERYVASMVRTWLGDLTARAGVVSALERLQGEGRLPEALVPCLAYGLALEGRQADAEAALAAVPSSQRGSAALKVIQWLELAGSRAAARGIYQAALQAPIPPQQEANIALAVAGDLAAAGRVAEAVKVLQSHRKPGLPTALAARYDVALARLLVQLGDIEEAEMVLGALSGRAEGEGAAAIALLKAQCALARSDYELARRLAQEVLAQPERRRELAPPPFPPGWSEAGPVIWVVPSSPPGGDVGLRAAAMFVMAGVMLREGKLDAAEEAYQRIVQKAAASAAATRAVQRLALIGDLRLEEQDNRKRFLDGLRLLDAARWNQARQVLAPWLQSTQARLADDARLLVAEAMAASRPEEAAAVMEELARDMPDSPLAAYALLAAAQLLAPLAPAEAVRTAAALRKQYPDSALAPLAAQLEDELNRKALAGT